MTTDAPPRAALPEAVRQILDEFRDGFGVEIALWTRGGDGERGPCLYPEDEPLCEDRGQPVAKHEITPRDGPALELEVYGDAPHAKPLAATLAVVLGRFLDIGQEIHFFTYELSERYEEINLLYSISETLGSVLRLDDAARAILGEVCDVLGALRGSLWVFDPAQDVLQLTASVGPEGIVNPLRVEDPHAVTARVFREGRSLIVDRDDDYPEALTGTDAGETDSFLSVPIRYTPPAGESRTVGVINLVGRRHGGRFTASDQKLLSAIASQVGAALENNRLIQESLAQERVAREMELAHHLQLKLLPVVEQFEGADVAARVEPAESVGGDFYHLFKLPEGRVGVMIGDVSSHGFPAALIMALAMSAASIYASEFGRPSMVLRHLDDALRSELESTEMYLTLFYGVIDPSTGRLVYSNAGHPHAFVVHGDGRNTRLGATDPPVGIAGSEAYGEEDVPWSPEDDILVLFTDGLSDTLPLDGSGESGEALVLAEVVVQRAGAAREIVSALFELASRAGALVPPDDRTALVLRA